MDPIKHSAVLSLTFCLLLIPVFLSADPGPGDIFREYHYADGRGIHLCKQGASRDSADFYIHVDDLEGAIRAEITGFFHTGHIGTSERRIRVNGKGWIDLPFVQVPGGRSECYFTHLFGRPSSPIALEDLHEGENRFTLHVGPQICHAFNWPCCGFHCFVLRVYYGVSKPHPEGIIEYPPDNHVITNDELMIKTKCTSTNAALASVDIVGHYFDYPFEGSGRYRDWHYMIDEFGRWYSFIDRRKRSPYIETWDLKWVPDQSEPMKLMARLTDASGISFMTPAVENLILRRESRSVRMYRATDVPENFKVRVGETKKCRFEPVTDDLGSADGVRLVSITCMGHMENKYLTHCGINDVILKQYALLPDLHSDFWYDTCLPVDAGLLKPGVNEFFVHSNTEGHMTEVCWPGPALLVSYELPAE